MSLTRLFEPGEATHVAAEQVAAGGSGRQVRDAAATGAAREVAQTFSSPLRMFVPGEATDIAVAQASAPRPRAGSAPRGRPGNPAADSTEAMRLFAPGEATDVAAAQAVTLPRIGDSPRGAREPLYGAGGLLRSLRLFEPGEAADVAAAQASAMPRRTAPRLERTEVAGAGAASTGAWAYPTELGGPLAGIAVAGEPAIAVPSLLTREPTVDPLLPEAQGRKKGPFSISIATHAVVLALVIARTSWMAAHQEPALPRDPGVFIALQTPQPEPQPAKPPIQAHAEPKSAQPPPEPAPKQTPRQAQALTPPPAPKELPPETPLPAPTRMGEQVPVPHYPVPGTVPPEEDKTGKMGAPGEKTAPPEPIGSPSGTNDRDAGAGMATGPGSPSTGDEDPSRDSGLIREKFLGGLDIRSHRPNRGRQGSGESEGGGSRRGMDFRLPGGDLGDFVFESKDYDWNDYRSQMYYAILRAWYNRLYLMTPNFERWAYLKGRRGLQGTVLVRFVIERSGAVSTIEVLEPSVMTPLDESARGALKEVILPRLPADFTKEREGVTGRFIMDVGDVGDFKQGLAWGKRRGDF